MSKKKEQIARLRRAYDQKITEYAVALQYGDKARALRCQAEAGEIMGRIRYIKSTRFELGSKIREKYICRQLDKLYGKPEM